MPVAAMILTNHVHVQKIRNAVPAHVWIWPRIAIIAANVVRYVGKARVVIIKCVPEKADPFPARPRHVTNSIIRVERSIMNAAP